MDFLRVRGHRLVFLLIAVMLLAALGCEDNITNLTVVQDTTPHGPIACTPTYCVWNKRHHEWVCLDAPLPDSMPWSYANQ